MFRRRARRVQFLAMRRARGRLAGVWQPVTGTRRRGEHALAAAMRELLEETGARPIRMWRLESATLFFDPHRDTLSLLPRFAAELGASQRIRLSSEHDASAFLAPRAAGRRFLWDSQRSGLAEVRSQILRGGRLARALELSLPPGSARVHPPRKRRA